jgi:hypothetical protein
LQTRLTENITMSPTNSIRKGSLSSDVSDEIPLDIPPAYSRTVNTTPPTTTATTTKKSWKQCNEQACLYPRTAPRRNLFLTVRTVNTVISVLLFALAFPAERVAHRGRWMSAVLSPSINAFFANVLDICFVYWKDRRSPPVQRMVWDGLLTLGFAISFGFMVPMTIPDIARTLDTSTPVSAGLGLMMDVCLFYMMWVLSSPAARRVPKSRVMFNSLTFLAELARPLSRSPVPKSSAACCRNGRVCRRLLFK